MVKAAEGISGRVFFPLVEQGYPKILSKK